jgi:glycosyltransferase involved in cell wall biosynthesis
MKRVAIYYDNRITGRNDGFPLYAWNLLRDKKLYPDIEVQHLIPNGDYSKFGKFNLNLVIDWGEDGLTNMIPYKVIYPEPFTYFASDTHLGYDYRLKMAKKAEHVFVAQKEGTEKMIKDGVKATWLPHGVEPRAFPSEPKAIKKYDVCFVGHLVSKERIDFLDRMFKEFPNFWFGSRLSRYVKVEEGVSDDCADIYRKTKIVLNPPTKGDVNMRVFEVLSTGSFLLTEEVYGLDDLFKSGVHLETYRNIKEAIDKTKFYLENDKEREKIAQMGMKECLEKNTYQQRLNIMLKANKII